MVQDLNVWGPECPSWDLNVWDPNVQDLNVGDLKQVLTSLVLCFRFTKYLEVIASAETLSGITRATTSGLRWT